MFIWRLCSLDASRWLMPWWCGWPGRVGIAEQLLQARADINAITNEGCTPLHKAAGAGHVEIVKMIVTAAGQAVSQVVSVTRPLISSASR